MLLFFIIKTKESGSTGGTGVFIKKDKVRMHDTDMAGIIYFAKVFRIVHDTMEDLMAQEGLVFQNLFTTSDFAFVIAHAEADYLQPMRVGDQMEIHAWCDKIGNASFTMRYDLLRDGKELVATAKTVHVTIEPESHATIPIPDSLRKSLEKYLR